MRRSPIGNKDYSHKIVSFSRARAHETCIQCPTVSAGTPSVIMTALATGGADNVTIWSKAVRRALIGAGTGWAGMAALTAARIATGRDVMDARTYNTLLAGLIVVSLLAGLAAILHGRVYQLGYLAGRCDGRDDDGDGGEVVDFPRRTG